MHVPEAIRHVRCRERQATDRESRRRHSVSLGGISQPRTGVLAFDMLCALDSVDGSLFRAQPIAAAWASPREWW